MKKIILIIILVSILLIAGCKKTTQETPTGGGVQTTTGNTIEIKSNGFNPGELTIKAGDTVTWINKDTVGHWPASAVHPTHEKYPGSSVTKCNTAEQPNIFDACKNLAQGESWSFTFKEKGTWFYHDHSNSRLFGKIVVE